MLDFSKPLLFQGKPVTLLTTERVCTKLWHRPVVVILEDGDIMAFNKDGTSTPGTSPHWVLKNAPERSSRFFNVYNSKTGPTIGAAFETRGEAAAATAGMPKAGVIELTVEDGKLVDVQLHSL